MLPAAAAAMLALAALGAVGAATPDVRVAIDWSRSVANSSTAVCPPSVCCASNSSFRLALAVPNQPPLIAAGNG